MQRKEEAPNGRMLHSGEPIPKDEKAHKRMVHTSRQSLVAVFLMGRPYYHRKHFRNATALRRVRCDLRRAAEQAAVRRKADRRCQFQNNESATHYEVALSSPQHVLSNA
jgi:hypothetical protein